VPDGGRGGRGGAAIEDERGWPLQAYFAALVVLFMVAAAAACAHVRLQTDHDAQRSAETHTRFAAATAAKQLGEGLTSLRLTVQQLAEAPGAAGLFADPSGCSLSYSGLGGPDAGHLDVVAPDGTVLCSSRSATDRKPWRYRRSGWLQSARSKPLFRAAVRDPATGRPSAIAAVPIPGHGVAVGVADLIPLGPALVALYGGPEPTTFLITDHARQTVLGRSADPARWVGARLAGTPFARGGHARERRDLDGRTRIYTDVAVPGVGWRFHAGVDKGAAFAEASRLQRRQLEIIVAGLAAMLCATLFTYRRVARPIARLNAAVAASGSDGPRARVPVGGPRDVRRLAEEINGFTESVQRELDARRSAEQAAEVSAHNYRLLFEGSPQPMWLYDVETLATREGNAAALAHYGFSREEFCGLTLKDLVSPDVHEALDRAQGDGWPTVEHAGPFVHVRKDGSATEVRVTAHTVMFEGRRTRLVIVEDVGERERLERQLRQSQRLESLGQLAGGVAHDFNNLLAVILNCAVFIREELEAATSGADPDWATAQRDVEQVERAAERGARLTHQLLAFARRDIVKPEVVDINQVIAGVEPLLRRTLGEHVRLTTRPRADLWPIVIDPGQLEQVLVNLAVNARDAMPDGGALRIDTDNIDVDSEFAASRVALTEGRYVRVRVSDTGTGMDGQTLQRVFEPFFTTKPAGAGTGLGLATVYGIIAQAGGYAQLYSEPGIGTTFTALVPATDDPVRETALVPERAATGGSEVVLLVEDEDDLRDVSARMLRRNGYRVLAAAGGREALELEATHADRIDLLITDVVMPGMPGKDVAARIAERRPGIGVLFISGYAHAVLDVQGQIEPDLALLEKPFTETALLTKVRALLDAPARPIR
jgi:PAS domain S-box-containing protein